VRLAGLLLLAGIASADSWAPYGQRFHLSDDGKHFLFLDGREHETFYRVYARPAGSLAPRATVERWGSKVVLDEKHRVLRHGVLKQTPLDAWVLSPVPRVVFFEKYGNLGYGTTLSLLTDGKVAWSLKLDDLKLDRKPFRLTMSSIHWFTGWWVDEPRKRIVLAAHGGQYREVELETGKVHVVEEPVVLAALKCASPRARAEVLAVCGRAKPEGWVPRVRAFRDDPGQPFWLRIDAAWALYMGADEEASAELFKKALKQLDEKIGWRVLHRATEMLGEESAPLLAELLVRGNHAREAAESLANLGAAGVELLDEIVSDDDVARATRLAAMRGLATARSEFAAATFAFAVRTGDESFAKDALAGLEEETNWVLHRALAKSLRGAGAGDAPIARILGRYPQNEYVRFLEQARARGTTAPEAVDAALKKCRAADR
jgi:hypothetical protein